MVHGEVSEVLPAPREVVFDVLHDYSRRLEWDTLLRAAYLDDGFNVAGKGVTSVCVGRRTLGGLALKTVYVSFERPRIAAVKMVNSPAFFRSWAASIQHVVISERESRVIYKFHFTAKPRPLRLILEPVMKRLFVWETQWRLRALGAYLARTQI